MKSGVYLNDDMLANVCKHHVTRMPYEIGRLAQDLAGGLMVTLPSEKDFEHPETGCADSQVPARAATDIADRRPHAHPAPDREHDARSQRGRLSHRVDARRRLAAGPARSRSQRQSQLEFKKNLAKVLAGIVPDSAEEISTDLTEYMSRVMATAASGVE